MTRHTARKAIFALLAVTLVLTACTNTDDPSTNPTTTTTVTSTSSAGGGSTGGGSGVGSGAGVGVPAFAFALQQFDQCDALLGWIQTEAVEQVGPYGFNNGGFGGRFGRAEFGEGTSASLDFAAADGAVTTQAATQEFSTTNVQEIGVDEPDLVKTDGERLYVLADNRLLSVEASAGNPVVIDSMSFGEVYPSQLLLGEDRLYVLGSHYVTDVAAFDRIGLPAFEQELFVVAEVLIGSDGSFADGARLEISGGYVTGRVVDGVARVIVRHDPQQTLPFVYPGNSNAEEAATAANKQVVLSSTIEDWLPFYRLIDADGNESGGMLPACDRVTAPQSFSGMSTVSVMSLDMGAPLDTGNALSLFGAASTVYASTDALYTATYEFPTIIFAEDGTVAEDPNPDFESAVHMFDITDPDGATYAASGAVPGTLLNQFAMSEHEGHLRVATTEGSPWWCCNEEQSSSSVTVLRHDGEQLVTTGSVGDLGIGESIFGVRFVGDTGYVVTFRQTDPLYVIDLRDPAAPAVTGELKITGYSAYLHPLADGYVLGVGQEATLQGNTIGTKVSLFDVSDPTDPREVDRWVLEQSSSQVEWDHKAFLYWAPESTAVIPVDTWNGRQFGAVAFDVIDGQIAERGRIVQGDVEDRGPRPGCEIVDREEFERSGVEITEESELFWLLQEATVVRCDDESNRGLPGFSCEPFEAFGFGDPDIDSVRGDAESFDICWPDYNESRQIRRSVVIGDVLWTIGQRTVQANDLTSLDVLGSTDL